MLQLIVIYKWSSMLFSVFLKHMWAYIGISWNNLFPNSSLKKIRSHNWAPFSVLFSVAYHLCGPSGWVQIKMLYQMLFKPCAVNAVNFWRLSRGILFRLLFIAALRCARNIRKVFSKSFFFLGNFSSLLLLENFLGCLEVYDFLAMA